jgi:hypothetical protein
MRADPVFATRIVRLAWTAAVALGVIWWLARTMIPAQPLALHMLAAAWFLMPSVLTISLRWPLLRYALAIPSSLATLGLLLICLYAPHPVEAARVGWLLTTAGVLLGGMLGMWFWFRWLPVPPGLVEPFSVGRWVLIGVHAGLIAGGVVLLILAASGLIQ